MTKSVTAMRSGVCTSGASAVATNAPTTVPRMRCSALRIVAPECVCNTSTVVTTIQCLRGR